MEKEHSGYFEEALSDFLYDAASGGAIRHLVDAGHSVEQIIDELDFPTPRERVEKTVQRYLLESGILLTKLPIEEIAMRTDNVKGKKRGELRKFLLERIEENGEENAYMLCSFGSIRKRDEEELSSILSGLTTREREYILGIHWEQDFMYHRLNSRMFEIGLQLAVQPQYESRFYFLKSKEIVIVELQKQ